MTFFFVYSVPCLREEALQEKRVAKERKVGIMISYYYRYIIYFCRKGGMTWVI